MRLLLCLATLLLLTRCGQPYCVAGIGDCQQMYDSVNSNPPSSTGLTLSASTDRVLAGNVLVLTIANGATPYKSCTLIDSATGLLSTLGTIGLADTTYCKYTAPTQTGSVVARVTDAGNATADFTITVY